MSSPNDCLMEADLRALVAGEAGSRAEALYQHLETCPRCAASFEANPEPLDDALRNHAADGDPVDPELVDRLIEKCRPFARSGDDRNAREPRGNEALEDLEKEVRQLLSPPRAPDEIGRLGRYRVLKVLDRGGEGVVLGAEDTVLKRPVAIKVMRPRLLGSDEPHQRFFREARAVARLDHEHIVPIQDIGMEGVVPFLVMPLLPGESLAARLDRESRPPLSLVLQVGLEAALALEAVHAGGLVHRDVKPANLWLKETGGQAVQVRLLDFGVAGVVPTAHRAQTPGEVGEEIIGTPPYMSPEQARGEQADARSDLFGLGCVLYEMLTGRRAFAGEGLAALEAVQRDEPAPPSAHDAVITRALSNLVMRLLSKQPEQRPRTREVIEALQSMRAGGNNSPTTPPPLAASEAEYPPPEQLRGLLTLILAAIALLTTGAIEALLIMMSGWKASTPLGDTMKPTVASRSLPTGVERIRDFVGHREISYCMVFSFVPPLRTPECATRSSLHSLVAYSWCCSDWVGTSRT